MQQFRYFRNAKREKASATFTYLLVHECWSGTLCFLFLWRMISGKHCVSLWMKSKATASQVIQGQNPRYNYSLTPVGGKKKSVLTSRWEEKVHPEVNSVRSGGRRWSGRIYSDHSLQFLPGYPTGCKERVWPQQKQSNTCSIHSYFISCRIYMNNYLFPSGMWWEDKHICCDNDN